MRRSTEDRGWKITEEAITKYQTMAKEDVKEWRITEMVEWLVSQGSIKEAMEWKWQIAVAR